MPKTDSFFIRAIVTATGGNYNQVSVDLGSYVDALGKSVLRVHNMSVQTFPANVGADWSIAAGTTSNLSFQLTTQSQTAMVDVFDKSVIASGALHISNTAGPGTGYTFLSDDADVMPQHWTNGYLIGVEQIYLAANTDAQLSTATVGIILECTVETLSQSAAMALALSQQ